MQFRVAILPVIPSIYGAENRYKSHARRGLPTPLLIPQLRGLSGGLLSHEYSVSTIIVMCVFNYGQLGNVLC